MPKGIGYKGLGGKPKAGLPKAGPKSRGNRTRDLPGAKSGMFVIDSEPSAATKEMTPITRSDTILNDVFKK